METFCISREKKLFSLHLNTDAVDWIKGQGKESVTNKCRSAGQYERDNVTYL